MAYPQSLINAWQSERLVYRAIEDNEVDTKLLWELTVNDPISVGMGSTLLLAPSALTKMTKLLSLKSGNLLHVFICLKVTEEEKESSATPTPIGRVALFPEFSDGPHHRNMLLGITIGDGYRGKGYGGEAINWALDWGFMRAGLHRIGLGCFSYNPAGLKLYRKLGFVEEGRERESVLFERKWHDIILFGMLEHEWEALRGVGKKES
ncbi:acyl-CoA N-acyltransferase [Bombardia bombarda]|uniref:Acyl-CoA N-acyltransferase n=1 Tax=Bombardia bombarda TaxID=252184 RepID=A0AA39WI62_9PEZI|nr:acyl-CoA N-acyltransferase [Bombardia bombarda]